MDRLDKGIDSRADLYAQLTTGWSGITYLPREERGNPKAKPQPLDFTRENAKLIYSEYTWVADQVKAFMEEEENFMKGPEGTNALGQMHGVVDRHPEKSQRSRWQANGGAILPPFRCKSFAPGFLIWAMLARGAWT